MPKPTNTNTSPPPSVKRHRREVSYDPASDSIDLVMVLCQQANPITRRAGQRPEQRQRSHRNRDNLAQARAFHTPELLATGRPHSDFDRFQESWPASELPRAERSPVVDAAAWSLKTEKVSESFWSLKMETRASRMRKMLHLCEACRIPDIFAFEGHPVPELLLIGVVNETKMTF